MNTRQAVNRLIQAAVTAQDIEDLIASPDTILHDRVILDESACDVCLAPSASLRHGRCASCREALRAVRERQIRRDRRRSR